MMLSIYRSTDIATIRLFNKLICNDSMERKVLLMLPAVILWTACSESREMNEGLGDAVVFKTIVGLQGRGAAASQDENANLRQGFGVFAYRNATGVADVSTSPNTLYNEHVTYTPGVGFDYTNTIYWPATDKLGFYAYSPYSTGGADGTGITDFVPAGGTVPGVPGFTFAVNDVTEDQIDLLVAKAEGLSGGTVPLPFIHALAKVEVQAHTSAVNYRVAIMDVRLNGIYGVGDYHFINGGTSWTNLRGEAAYSAELQTTGNSKPDGTGVPAVIVLYNNNSTDYTEVTDPADALYLLPQSLGPNAQMVITYNIYNAQTGNLISAQISQDLVLDIWDEDLTLSGLVKWEKSRRIIYRLNFIQGSSGPGSEVKFEATVSDWSLEYGDIY